MAAGTLIVEWPLSDSFGAQADYLLRCYLYIFLPHAVCVLSPSLEVILISRFFKVLEHRHLVWLLKL